MHASRTVCAPLLVAALASAGCWTYDTVTHEFDSVAGYDPQSAREPSELVYGSEAERYPWLVRQLEWTGAADLLGGVLAFERGATAVDEPSRFARERIGEIAAVAGNRLDRLAGACWRLLLVVEKDPHALNRAVAVDGLAALAGAFRSQPLDPDENGLKTQSGSAEAFRNRAKDAIAVLDAHWPQGAERRTWSAEARDSYATALRDLSRLDAGSIALERARLRAVAEALRDETDYPVYDLVARYLLECVRAATNRGLAAALADDDPRVRETAVRGLWQLGGAAALRLAIARLLANHRAMLDPRERGTALVDPDPDLRRRLVHLAWSLPFAATQGAVEGGKSPLEFLVETAVNDPERPLRFAASEALAFLLQREVDPSGSWIPEWWQRFVTEGGANAR